jgi:sodium-dependent dicarboxylate transporter 2/3/5
VDARAEVRGVAFVVTAALWITPGLVALLAGETSALYRGMNARVPEAAAAVWARSSSSSSPATGRARDHLGEAAKIDWGVILLYGGGFALGVLSFQTGLAEAVGRGLDGAAPAARRVRAAGGVGDLVAVLVSETTSNTASANMVVPVVISIARPRRGRPASPPRWAPPWPRAWASCSRYRPPATPSSTARATSR